MTKERKTISLEPAVKNYLDSKDNASALVNRLVEAHMKGVDTQLVGLEIQERHFEREAQAALEEHERYQEQLDEIRKIRQDITQQESIELETVRKKLEDTPLEPSNPAVKKRSEELGMSPRKLCEELQ